MIDENDKATGDLFESERVFAKWIEGLDDDDESECVFNRAGNTRSKGNARSCDTGPENGDDLGESKE